MYHGKRRLKVSAFFFVKIHNRYNFPLKRRTKLSSFFIAQNSMCLRCEIYVHEYSYARVARLYKYSYTYIMVKKYLDALDGWCMR